MSAGHVFISHGSENHRAAEEISRFIEGRGIKTWMAPRDVRPGMDYSEQLQSAIEQCLAFVVLISETANTSPYVRAETEMAFSNNKPIFPVRQSEVMPAAGLAFFLKIRHWTNAFGSEAEASMERLAQELRTLAGLPAEAAAPVREATPAVPRPPAPAPEPVSVPPQPAARIAEPGAKGGLPKTTLFAMAAGGLLIVVVALVLVIGQNRADPVPPPAPSPEQSSKPVPEPTPTPAAPSVRDLIVGRWANEGDCSQALEFTADGQIIAPDGQNGTWQLNGDRLSVTENSGQTETVQISSIDQSAISFIDNAGEVRTIRRC